MPTVAFAIVLTLTPGATALAVATDALWVPRAQLAPQHRMGGLRMSPLVAFIPMPTVAFAIVRHRAANRLDHVTLTPGATALAVRFMSQKHPSRPGRALNIIHP
jgi:hypothetical protein